MTASKTHDFNQYVDRTGSDSWKWSKEFPGVQFPMGCADMDFQSAAEIKDALHQRIDNAVLGYTGYDCLAEMADAIAGYYQRRHSHEVNPGHVVYNSGLMVAFNLLLETFASPGDQVIIQTPVFHNFKTVIQRAGLTVSENALQYNAETLRYSIDFDDLELRAQDPRATVMMLCNPMNPVGKMLSADEMQKIFDICQRNGVLLLSDEVHGDLYFDNKKHIPLHAVSEEIKNNTIIISASGKTFNLATFYASYLVIPNDTLRARYNVAAQRHHFDINEFGVIANTVAYRDCDYYIDGLVDYLQGNLDCIREFLAEKLPSVKLIELDATYLAWLDFSEWDMNTTEAHALLLEHGVGLANGANFGPVGEGFMRMNFACHRDTLLGALNAIEQAYNSTK